MSYRADIQRLMQQPRPMCGGCKATGIKHAWDAQALLAPAEPREPCPACNGSGWFGEEFSAPVIADQGGKS